MRGILLTLSLLIFSASMVLAQKTVEGTVTSEEGGSSIPGVNVVVKGTTTGTVTDIDGNYTISVPSDGGVLVFSFIGYTSQEIEIGNQSVISIRMATEVTQLSEIVITGYGNREKRTYVGSISQIDSKMIENKSVNSIDMVLLGSIPGLQLTASSGTPGSVQDIRIRGLSSITASNSPLFVIDGVPVNSNTTEITNTGTLSALASINANDIESISVLKDASATAVYGARGANGVIIITTKKGKSGKTVVSLNAQYGSVARATDAAKMLNASQWDELYYEALVNAGQATDIADAKANFDSGWDGVTDTDWTQEVINQSAMSQQYDLAVNGGNDKTNYYASLGYFQQDGVNIGSNMDRVSGKLNIGTFPFDKVNFTNSFSTARTIQNGQLEGDSWFGNPDAAYMFLRPTDRARNEDGTVNITDISGVFYNPLYFPDNDIREIVQIRVLNNTGLIFDITDDIQFNSIFGVDYINTEELVYRNRAYGGSAPPSNGSSHMTWNRIFNYVWKNQLNYSLEIGTQHDLAFSIIYEAQRNDWKTVGTGGYGIAADGLYYPSSVGTPDLTLGYVWDWAINSFTGLINYGLSNKVFADVSLRREGNSRFAPEYRWGTFWAVGASYLLSEESFLEASEIFTFAKIRASYGKTGNAGIFANRYQSLLDYSGAYNGFPAESPEQVGNSVLSWENNKQLSIGIITTLFDRFFLEAEYYNRLSYDLLFDVPLSRTTGFTNQVQNIGEMVNKGFEVSLSSDIIRTRDFTWNLGINFTTVYNEVTKLPKDGNGDEIGIVTSTYKITEGQPAYVYYMPTWAGVDPDNGAPLWYVDSTLTETTSVYSEAGDVFQNGSRIAKFFGGLNTRLEYKGIYLTAQLYYQEGNYVYDVWASYTQSDGLWTYNITNGYARQYDRWQQPGDISPNPINVIGNTSGSANISTRSLYDGTYFRLRNITLGYYLPAQWLSSLKIVSANIYLQGNNFYTWKKDSLLEFDPEVGANGALSLNPSVLKTLIVGLNLKF